MSLIPFPGCSGHRAGFWGSGSVRLPGLARKWAQAPNSLPGLVLDGEAGLGKPQVAVGGGLEPWGFPCEGWR